MNPILQEKKDAVNFLLSCDLATISNATLKEYILIILERYTHIATHFHPGLILYRGVKYESKPLSYSQLIYPPKRFATIGRANEDGEQMFYCTSLKKAPFSNFF